MDSGHNIEKLDIVYCLKEGSTSEELKYSLRSLKNIPHRDVWIIGGCPDWVNEEVVHCVPMEQTGTNKWAKSNSSVRRACEIEEISDNFILFNDDFFVLKPVEKLPPYYHKTLAYRVREIMARQNVWANSGYTRRLSEESRFLKFMGKSTYNYAVHIPMVFNKEKMLFLFEKYPDRVISRAVYGNYFEVGGEDVEDVKIYDTTSLPEDDWTFLSTSDLSFADGEVGKWIRKQFKNRSEYERSTNGTRQSKPKGSNNPRRNRGKKSGISEEMEKPSNVRESEVQEVLYDETKE